MRFAYADPPYLGRGEYYVAHHPDAMRWNKPEAHRELVERLQDEYPDGWALSLSEQSLRIILPMCPERARVAAWITANTRMVGRGQNAVRHHFEPVIFFGGRSYADTGARVADFVITAQQRMDDGAPRYAMNKSDIRAGKTFLGRKPRAFCDWVIALLGARNGDIFDDLFPGTGAFTSAWLDYCGQPIQTGMFAPPTQEGKR